MSNRNYWPVRILSASVLGIVLLGNVNPARGHGLDLACQVEPDGRIHAELRYHDGGPAQGAVVRWLDETGSILGQSRTDEKGRCTFRPQGQKPFRAEGIISGHRAVFVFQPEGASATRPSSAESAAPPDAEPHTHLGHTHPEIDMDDSESAAGRSTGFHRIKSSETAVRVVAGLALILGAAALVMAMTQRKTIRQLQQRMDRLGREKP